MCLMVPVNRVPSSHGFSVLFPEIFSVIQPVSVAVTLGFRIGDIAHEKHRARR